MSTTISALEKLLADTTYKISDVDKICVQEIVNKYPHFLKDIDDAMEKIMKDGKLDIFDVPQIIIIICTVSNNILENFNVKGISNLVGVIADAVIFPQDGIDAENEAMKKMVTASLLLLNTSISRPKKSFLWCGCSF